MIMSVSLQVLGKAICPVLISRCACLYECPPVRSVCFYCPVQNVVNHRLRWAHPRVCGENKKWHKCHVCSENSLKMTLRLVHFEPSQPPAFEIQSILLTIQHHYDSPGMTKARDPRPARKKTVGWLASLAICKCRAFGPRFLTGFYFEPRGGVPTRQD